MGRGESVVRMARCSNLGTLTASGAENRDRMELKREGSDENFKRSDEIGSMHRLRNPAAACPVDWDVLPQVQ